MRLCSKTIGIVALVVVIATGAFADGIHNPSSNSVGDFQGIDSNPPTSGGSTLACTYTPVTTGTQNVAYTGATPSASGGVPAYTFSETGSLPTGLSINTSTGVISGTPSVNGSFPGIQVKVTDTASTVANCGASFTLVISYTAQGVAFSSTTTMHRAGLLTGVTDSKIGLISFWFRGNAGSDGTTVRVFGENNGHFLIDRLSTGVMRLTATDSSATNLLQMSTVGTFNSASGWKHFIASWNQATATAQMYVEDVSDNAGAAPDTNGTIGYATGASDYIFNVTGVNGAFDIADFWFDPNQVLDLSVTANRRNFISAGLAPVNLGTNGSTPTGTQPAAFFSGAVASWQTNKAAGGGFTITAGSITAASSNPP